MKNNKNTTVEHDIPSNDGQNDGIATQQAVRPVMQGELLTLPDMGPTGRPIKTSANLCALIRFQAWYPRYNLMTGEAELDNSDGERLGGSEAGQRSALVDACQLAGVPDAAIEEHLIAICERHSYHPVRHWLERGAPWDGIPRIDAAIATLNAANLAYASAGCMHGWLGALLRCITHAGTRNSCLCWRGRNPTENPHGLTVWLPWCQVRPSIAPSIQIDQMMFAARCQRGLWNWLSLRAQPSMRPAASRRF